MPARIFCKTGELAGVSAEIDAEATLGRGASATVELPTELISNVHARIRFEPEVGRYVLEDLGSTNGTWLDGIPVERPERLGHLHVITFSEKFDFIFQDLALCAERHGTPLPAPKPAAKPAAKKAVPEGTMIQEDVLPIPSFLAGEVDDEAAAKQTRIHQDLMLQVPSFLGGEAAEGAERPAFAIEVGSAGDVRRFPLQEGENLLGRGVDAGVRIEMPSISRRHALVTVKSGRTTVRDLGSINRTFVDGEEIETDVEVEVRPGMILSFGSVGAKLIPWRRDDA